MSSERNYYVLCENNCKFEGMTKEQILAAIEQAVSTGEIQDVDTGFITTIKEQKSGEGLKFWVGTQAEYNAIEEQEKNCFYIITDDTFGDDVSGALVEMQKVIEAYGEKITTHDEEIASHYELIQRNLNLINGLIGACQTLQEQIDELKNGG